MTWHLKDKQLEEKLIGLCSDFLEALNNGVYSKRKDENYILVSFDREKLGNYLDGNELLFWMDELEEVHDYNPKAWNEYPKVKPVNPGIYRLEVKYCAGGATQCYAAVFDFSSHKNWYIYGQGCLIDTNVSDGGYVRFRPWDD